MKHDVSGTGCSLRIEYDYQDKIIFILFYGLLRFEGIEVSGLTKSQLKDVLLNKGFTIQDSYFGWGCYCPELCLDFASSEDDGGETDEVDSMRMFYAEEYWDEFK